ncbi:unnamed protein product, partial [Mesorhabditis spiculigera]
MEVFLLLWMFFEYADAVFLQLLADPVDDRLLLQMNRVYTQTLPAAEPLLFDISLFQSCPQFNLILTTESYDSTRVLFSYNFKGDLTVSTNSSKLLPPSAAPLSEHHECREFKRKSIEMKVTRTDFNYRISIGKKSFLRPRDPNSNDLRIFIPQQTDCCLIRALLFQPEMPSTPTPVILRRSKLTPGDPFAEKAEAIEAAATRSYEHPTIASLADDKEAANTLYSWTRKINEGWNTTFLAFGAVMVLLFGGFSVFGLVMFVCLQKPPKHWVEHSAIAASTINTFRSVLSKQSSQKANNFDE